MPESWREMTILFGQNFLAVDQQQAPTHGSAQLQALPT